MRESELKLAKSLWLLGGFGFTHRTHEWLELFLLLQRRHMSLEQLFVIKSITLFVLICRFSASDVRAYVIAPSIKSTYSW